MNLLDRFIDIKLASNGCVGVKEYYKMNTVWNSSNIKIEADFCVDKTLNVCVPCIFKGNTLVPLKAIPQEFELTLRGKKGIYSRLDCVFYVVRFQGTYDVTAKKWTDFKCVLMTPHNVNSDKLVLVPSEKVCNPVLVKQAENRILANVGNCILSKDLFIRTRCL